MMHVEEIHTRCLRRESKAVVNDNISSHTKFAIQATTSDTDAGMYSVTRGGLILLLIM